MCPARSAALTVRSSSSGADLARNSRARTMSRMIDDPELVTLMDGLRRASDVVDAVL
jgi:hypothetical protein